jgi:hypothetical protein
MGRIGRTYASPGAVRASGEAIRRFERTLPGSRTPRVRHEVVAGLIGFAFLLGIAVWWAVAA